MSSIRWGDVGRLLDHLEAQHGYADLSDTLNLRNIDAVEAFHDKLHYGLLHAGPGIDAGFHHEHVQVHYPPEPHLRIQVWIDSSSDGQADMDLTPEEALRLGEDLIRQARGLIAWRDREANLFSRGNDPGF